MFQGEARAHYGAEPFKDGCAFWFDPDGRIPIRWILKNAHALLRTVCYGRYVVVAVENDDRVMSALADAAGFELLEREEARELRYLTII